MAHTTHNSNGSGGRRAAGDSAATTAKGPEAEAEAAIETVNVVGTVDAAELATANVEDLDSAAKRITSRLSS